MALFLDGLFLAVFGGSVRAVPQIIPGTVTILNVPITLQRLMLCVVALAVTIFLYWALSSTRLGKALRAVAADHEAAMLQGIPYNNIAMIGFMLASLLAAVAGVLIAPVSVVSPVMGTDYLMKTFHRGRRRRPRQRPGRDRGRVVDRADRGGGRVLFRLLDRHDLDVHHRHLRSPGPAERVAWLMAHLHVSRWLIAAAIILGLTFVIRATLRREPAQSGRDRRADGGQHALRHADRRTELRDLRLRRHRRLRSRNCDDHLQLAVLARTGGGTARGYRRRDRIRPYYPSDQGPVLHVDRLCLYRSGPDRLHQDRSHRRRLRHDGHLPAPRSRSLARRFRRHDGRPLPVHALRDRKVRLRQGADGNPGQREYRADSRRERSVLQSHMLCHRVLLLPGSRAA